MTKILKMPKERLLHKKLLVQLLILIWCPQFGNLQPDAPDFSKIDYCSIICSDNRVHTMCNVTKGFAPNCRGKQYHHQDPTHKRQEAIIIGHNGIRNRIAGRMRVANMRKVYWDDTLAEWSKAWSRQCRPYENDPCTDLPRVEGEIHTYVKQNIAFLKSQYYPPSAVVKAIRTWYRERNHINPPYYRQLTTSLIGGYFNVNNNFTNLACATFSHIGCSVTRMCDGYFFVCNYFDDNGADYKFLSGAPTSSCHPTAPLSDFLFTNLCAADSGQVKRNHINKILLYILLILSIASL